MKATFFGIGYVGLVQAAVLADAGHEICCVDVNQKKIDQLKLGIIPIYEPGLSNLVQKNHTEGRLHFTSCPKKGVEFSDLQFIAVGTPPDEDGSADLTYVLKVAESIATNMQQDKIIINKSTVPVGTADKVSYCIEYILEKRKVDSLNFTVISNPEFLKEGSAINDCKRPDRIIIGSNSDSATQIVRELYAPFNRNHEKIITMDVRSAELTKYAANCMLATKISFMNEMANIAENVGADIEQVRKGIGSDPRIGYHFIYPGIGYGGSCFPKDIKALINTSSKADYHSEIINAVENVNLRQKNKLFQLISEYFQGDIKGKRFALWGLAFKPNTDDMRDAPSRVLMEALWNAGAQVQAFDPKAMEETQRIYPHEKNLSLYGTKESALKEADALIICTEWQNFKAPDFDTIKAHLKAPIIFDGRNLFEPSIMASKGFAYISIGRPNATL